MRRIFAKFHLPARRRESFVPLTHYLVARKVFRTDAELAGALGVSPRDLARWKRGELAAETGRRLRHLAVAISELEEFLDPSVIEDWLTSKSPGELKSPLDWLREGNLAEVLHLVNATEHGAYS